MPTSLQRSDGISASSSEEEACARVSSLPSTKVAVGANTVYHAALEQERMDRTNDVRQRLGPLIERLKHSVTKIRDVQNSMRISADGHGDSGDDFDVEEKDKNTRLQSVLTPERSQKLMNESMEMVKEKMFRLKIMEEELATSEDRRVNLHHYFHHLWRH